jgi:hypothetical protein
MAEGGTHGAERRRIDGRAVERDHSADPAHGGGV